MYLQPSAHQEHGRGEQPQGTLVEAALKDAWRGSKHSHPYGVVGMEKKKNAGELQQPPAPLTLGRSQHQDPPSSGFWLPRFAQVFLPTARTTFALRMTPTLPKRRLRGSVPPAWSGPFSEAQQQHCHRQKARSLQSPSSAFAYYIVQKSVGEKQKPSLQPLEERIRKKQLFSNFFCPSAETRTSCRTKLWFWL